MYIADQTLKEKKIRNELAANWNFEMENCKITKLVCCLQCHIQMFTPFQPLFKACEDSSLVSFEQGLV